MSIVRRLNYSFSCWLIRTVWRTIGKLDVHGLENLPATGACLVIANHASYLDPLLLGSVAPRPLHAMAKSTQFANPIMARVIAFVYTFPVRRYEIDPQAVRTVLRRLGQGHAIMIFVEGERTWDGRLQPLRLGTIRLLLKAGVPVIPARIDGTFDAWPRWHSKLKPGPVTVRFGPALHFPKLDTRAERDAVLHDARAKVIAALSSEADRTAL